ncbi:hypothetical protein J437_LFUL017041, partial [Ladona fulva]
RLGGHFNSYVIEKTFAARNRKGIFTDGYDFTPCFGGIPTVVMAVVPIYNPPVPYLGYIEGGFGPGRMVRIQGSISPSAQRFAVNLQCGPNTNPRDDIALHLSPRFSENFIMRSSLQNQSWSGEETHGSMLLARGQPFEVLILCESNCYKIALNNQHFGEYMHRIPYNRVSHLTIDGDVTLSIIAFEGGFAPPPMTGNGVPGYAPQPAMAGMVPPMPGVASYPPGHMPPYGAQPMYGGAPYGAPPGPQAYGGYGGYGGHGQPPPPPGYQVGFSNPSELSYF